IPEMFHRPWPGEPPAVRICAGCSKYSSNVSKKRKCGRQNVSGSEDGLPSVPKRTRSWYLTMKSRQNRGARPRSWTVAAVSTIAFGYLSSSAATPGRIVVKHRHVRVDED